jgi:hypothetical protein
MPAGKVNGNFKKTGLKTSHCDDWAAAMSAGL